MKAIEHVYGEGDSGFEFTEITHGEYRALAGLKGDELVAHVRSNAQIVTVNAHEPVEEPADDEWLVAPREPKRRWG